MEKLYTLILNKIKKYQSIAFIFILALSLNQCDTPCPTAPETIADTTIVYDTVVVFKEIPIYKNIVKYNYVDSILYRTVYDTVYTTVMDEESLDAYLMFLDGTVQTIYKVDTVYNDTCLSTCKNCFISIGKNWCLLCTGKK